MCQRNGRQVYISATRIKTFKDCKFKFNLKYIDKKTATDTPPPFVFGVGNAVHKLAQTYTLLKKNQKEDELKKEILHWLGRFNLSNQYYYNVLEQYKTVKNYMNPFLEDQSDDKCSAARETKINTHWFSDYWFYGYIDLKVVYDDRVIVTDYKSSKEEDDHTLQLGIYAYDTAHRNGRQFCDVETHIVYTKLGKVVKKTFTKSEVKDVLIDVADTIRASEKADSWPKQTNQYCDFCEYYSYCKPFGDEDE